jgi:hypothetical protein
LTFPKRRIFQKPKKTQKKPIVNFVAEKKLSDEIDVADEKRPQNNNVFCQQKIVKDDTTTGEIIKTLTEKQACLFFFLSKLIINHDGQSSGRIKRGLISNATGLCKETIRTAEKALIKKKLIKRKSWGAGPTGYTIYEHASLLVKQLSVEYKKLYNLNYFVTTLDNNTEKQNRIEEEAISDEWRSFDQDLIKQIGLAETDFVFLFRHYKQNPQIRLSAEIVEQSLKNLCYDLTYGQNYISDYIKKEPAKNLIHILKKGKPYRCNTPGGYKDPVAKELSFILKEKEKTIAERSLMGEKIKQLEFDEWKNNLSEEVLLELCPESEIAEGVPKKLRKTMRRRRALELSKDYFEAEIWPTKKKEIFKEQC